MTKDAKGLYDEENVVTENWTKWDKIGNSYEGVYVAKYVKPNTLKDKTLNKASGEMEHPPQTVYVLVQDNGEIIKANGPGGRDLGQFNSIKLGTYVGIKYVKDIAPKKAGFQPSKQVTVFSTKEIKQEVLDNYLKENGLYAQGNEAPDVEEEPQY